MTENIDDDDEKHGSDTWWTTKYSKDNIAEMHTKTLLRQDIHTGSYSTSKPEH